MMFRSSYSEIAIYNPKFVKLVGALCFASYDGLGSEISWLGKGSDARGESTAEIGAARI